MTNCTRTCWIAAAVFGLLVLIFTSGIGSLRWFEGLFLGVIAAGLGGQLLIWLVCSGSEAASGADWQPVSSQASTAPQPGPRETVAGFADLGMTAKEPQSVGPSGDAQVRTGDTVSGAAARNDIYGSKQSVSDNAVIAPAQVKGDETVKAGPDSGAKQEPSVKTAPKAKAEAKGKAKDSAKVKTKAKKKAEKKAKDDGKASAKLKAESKASPKVKSEPKAKAASKTKADNLTEIKGIGPKYKKLLAKEGINTFAQIAAWSDAEIDEFGDTFGNIGSRIRSEEWVEQAKILASGGDTEFSKRVEKGEVY